MQILETPFRYDYVGSFLRPDILKQARAQFARGEITQAQLTAVEDQAIRDLVAKQKAAGYHVINDGEFRRAAWHLDFFWGFQGIDHKPLGPGEETPDPADTWLSGKLSAEAHPFVDHFRFVQAMEDDTAIAKQTIPAPSQLFHQLTLPGNLARTRAVYPTDEELIRDIAQCYRRVIQDLYAAGCRSLQLDDRTWAVLAAAQAKGEDVTQRTENLLAVNNLSLEGRPYDLVVATHVCQGDDPAAGFSQGAYDPVAEPLFRKAHMDVYYLEFDGLGDASFQQLQQVARYKKVVLGLVSSTDPALENKADLIACIHKAAQYIPLDRLYLSPHCGFSAHAGEHGLTEAQQWAKLALVKEIAEEVWGVSPTGQ
jgi:methionine synthase II (cobalamin-independent)